MLGKSIQKLASQYLKKDWLGIKAEERSDYRSMYSVWKSLLEGTMQVAQSRLNICENYKNLISEPARSVRCFKEQQLKKLKARRSECNSKAIHARNDYLLTLAAANAHQDRYYQTDLVNIMKALDGNISDHLKDYLVAFSRTELETCQAVQKTFQFLLETSSRVPSEDLKGVVAPQVVRDSNLQLFLQENSVFHKPQPFQFQPSDSDTSRQLESETGTTEEHSLNKEARKWATRVAREHKAIVHSQRINADAEKEEGEEFEDSMDVFDDSSSSPSGTLRNYPLTCKASQPDELTIEEHEVLEVIEDGDMEDWVKARNKAGQVGYVPEKYLQFPTSSSLLSMLQSLAALDSRSHTSTNSTEADLGSGSLNGDASVCFVKALYDYEGQTEDELSFPEGAIIRILHKENQEDDGFWEGEVNGRIGVFPSVLVEELTGTENGHSPGSGDCQVSPTPKPNNVLPLLPLYDQPPTSPYPSPDKRGSHYFPRSPSTNGKGFGDGKPPVTAKASLGTFMMRGEERRASLQRGVAKSDLARSSEPHEVRAAPPPPTQPQRRPAEKIEDVEITLV
ncbi:F-BAR and double SH3 domain protein 2 isoform X2 [Willisornis vidua]|uniref:F-BAR and double SH3 domain protein 2 isoform X2 n=1 Tax=Willisornis vidua TaxID=1566151 RepID=A0ABQ9DNQ9_9PASS|nr:F-BAR and double SH3 domain protein 2 isoform X2 [Willisornis vidua]